MNTSRNTKKLIRAAVSGSLSNVRRLIMNHGIDVNGRNKRGEFPLLVAANCGRAKVVAMLLEANANVNQCSSVDQSTVLHEAAYFGHERVCELLLFRGAHVDAKDETGATPFIVAAENGSLEVLRILKNSNADIYAQIQEGYTALYVAVENNHLEVVEYLLSAGVDANRANDTMEFTPLTKAVQGKRSIVKALLRFGADANLVFNAAGITPLMCAAKAGRLDVIKVLVKHGAEPETTSGGCSALHAAILFPTTVKGQSKSFKAARLLIKLGAAVNHAQEGAYITPLNLAIEKGSLLTVKALVKNGAHINNEWIDDADDAYYGHHNARAPLFLAAAWERVKIVKYLLKKGAYVYPNVLSEYAPLIGATHKRCVPIVRMLLKKGANPNVCESNGHAVLCRYYAAFVRTQARRVLKLPHYWCVLAPM